MAFRLSPARDLCQRGSLLAAEHETRNSKLREAEKKNEDARRAHGANRWFLPLYPRSKPLLPARCSRDVRAMECLNSVRRERGRESQARRE